MTAVRSRDNALTVAVRAARRRVGITAAQVLAEMTAHRLCVVRDPARRPIATRAAQLVPARFVENIFDTGDTAVSGQWLRHDMLQPAARLRPLNARLDVGPGTATLVLLARRLAVSRIRGHREVGVISSQPVDVPFQALTCSTCTDDDEADQHQEETQDR